MISIIIPAHNEEKYIENCLNSIKNQNYQNYEIIVVCDACTDNTFKIAKNYTKNVYAINARNTSKARNFGAAKARGDIFIFLDADSIISKNLLFMVEKAINKGYMGGVSNTWPLENIVKAKIMLWLDNYVSRRFIYPSPAGFIFCKNDVFPRYDESLKIGEDTVMYRKLRKKGKVKFIRNAYIKTSMRRFEKKGYLRTILQQFFGPFSKNQKYEAVR